MVFARGTDRKSETLRMFVEIAGKGVGTMRVRDTPFSEALRIPSFSIDVRDMHTPQRPSMSPPLPRDDVERREGA